MFPQDKRTIHFLRRSTFFLIFFCFQLCTSVVFTFVDRRRNVNKAARKFMLQSSFFLNLLSRLIMICGVCFVCIYERSRFIQVKCGLNISALYRVCRIGRIYLQIIVGDHRCRLIKPIFFGYCLLSSTFIHGVRKHVLPDGNW